MRNQKISYKIENKPLFVAYGALVGFIRGIANQLCHTRLICNTPDNSFLKGLHC